MDNINTINPIMNRNNPQIAMDLPNIGSNLNHVFKKIFTIMSGKTWCLFYVVYKAILFVICNAVVSIILTESCQTMNPILSTYMMTVGITLGRAFDHYYNHYHYCSAPVCWSNKDHFTTTDVWMLRFDMVMELINRGIAGNIGMNIFRTNIIINDGQCLDFNTRIIFGIFIVTDIFINWLAGAVLIWVKRHVYNYNFGGFTWTGSSWTWNARI
jgi:hypothetical protein